MAMSTTLFAVSAETLAHLKAQPDAIMELDSKDVFSTYLWTSIPYFLAADEYVGDGEEDDGDDGDPEALADILNGTDSVKCARLENGCFDVFEPSSLNAELAVVDLGEIEKRVLDAGARTAKPLRARRGREGAGRRPRAPEEVLRGRRQEKAGDRRLHDLRL
jgi:hypothetical protein